VGVLRKLCAAVIAAAFIAGVYAHHENNRPHLITFNGGGMLGDFIAEYNTIRRSGRTVIIDGVCISACTLVLGLLPLDRICMTPFGKLAFHSASYRGLHSSEGTRLAWQLYPETIRKLLRERGWNGAAGPHANEHQNLIYLDGADLAGILSACP
jgi:hypothetical protein